MQLLELSMLPPMGLDHPGCLTMPSRESSMGSFAASFLSLGPIASFFSLAQRERLLVGRFLFVLLAPTALKKAIALVTWRCDVVVKRLQLRTEPCCGWRCAQYGLSRIITQRKDFEKTLSIKPSIF